MDSLKLGISMRHSKHRKRGSALSACKNVPIGSWMRVEGQSSKDGNVSENLLCAAENALVQKVYEEVVCKLPGNPRSTFLMVFSPDGTKVASTHGDHNIYVTDLRTGRCICTLQGHPRTPWCIAFHPFSNEILASGCLGGEVRVWDLHGGSEVWTAEGHTVIASLAFHPTDRILVIATYNELHFWDWSMPQPFTKCSTGNDKEKVRFVSFDPLGFRLITGIANRPVVQSQWDQAPNQSASQSSAASHVTWDTERQLSNRYNSLLEQYERLLRCYRDISSPSSSADVGQQATSSSSADNERSSRSFRYALETLRSSLRRVREARGGASGSGNANSNGVGSGTQPRINPEPPRRYSFLDTLDAISRNRPTVPTPSSSQEEPQPGPSWADSGGSGPSSSRNAAGPSRGSSLSAGTGLGPESDMRHELQLLSWEIENMQRICSRERVVHLQRRQIVQLQQIRRILEDLQRQIRSLHASVRESLDVISNVGGGGVEEDAPSSSSSSSSAANTTDPLSPETNPTTSRSEESQPQSAGSLSSFLRFLESIARQGLADSTTGGTNASTVSSSSSSLRNEPSRNTSGPGRSSGETTHRMRMHSHVRRLQQSASIRHGLSRLRSLAQPLFPSGNGGNQEGNGSSQRTMNRQSSQAHRVGGPRQHPCRRVPLLPLSRNQGSSARSSASHATRLRSLITAAFNQTPPYHERMSSNAQTIIAELRRRLQLQASNSQSSPSPSPSPSSSTTPSASASASISTSPSPAPSLTPSVSSLSSPNPSFLDNWVPPFSSVSSTSHRSNSATVTPSPQSCQATARARYGTSLFCSRMHSRRHLSTPRSAGFGEISPLRRRADRRFAFRAARQMTGSNSGGPAGEWPGRGVIVMNNVGTLTQMEASSSTDSSLSRPAAVEARAPSTLTVMTSPPVEPSSASVTVAASGNSAGQRPAEVPQSNGSGSGRSEQSTGQSLRAMLERLESQIRQQREQFESRNSAEREPIPGPSSDGPSTMDRPGTGANPTMNRQFRFFRNQVPLDDSESDSDDDSSEADWDSFHDWRSNIEPRLRYSDRDVFSRRMHGEDIDWSPRPSREPSSWRNRWYPGFYLRDREGMREHFREISRRQRDRERQHVRDIARRRAHYREVLSTMVESLTNFFEQHGLVSDSAPPNLDDRMYNLFLLLRVALQLTSLILSELQSIREAPEERTISRLPNPFSGGGSRSNHSAPSSSSGGGNNSTNPGPPRVGRDLRQGTWDHFQRSISTQGSGVDSPSTTPSSPTSGRRRVFFCPILVSRSQNSQNTVTHSSSQAPSTERRSGTQPSPSMQRHLPPSPSSERRPASPSTTNPWNSDRFLDEGNSRRQAGSLSAALGDLESVLRNSHNQLLESAGAAAPPPPPPPIVVPEVLVNGVAVSEEAPATNSPSVTRRGWPGWSAPRASDSSGGAPGEPSYRTFPQRYVTRQEGRLLSFLHPVEGRWRENLRPHPQPHPHPHPQPNSHFLSPGYRPRGRYPSEFSTLRSFDYTFPGSFFQEPVIITNTCLALTHRIQVWDFLKGDIPDISDPEKNVVVKECKIHNDASVSISNDGRILATLLPGHFSGTTMLGIYSLSQKSLGQCLYTWSFEQNAVSVSLSPTAHHVVVGLASRRACLLPSERQTIAQVFRLDPPLSPSPPSPPASTSTPSSSSSALPPGGKGRLRHMRDYEQSGEQSYVSLNCIRWAPMPGQGTVYGTNMGHLKILR